MYFLRVHVFQVGNHVVACLLQYRHEFFSHTDCRIFVCGVALRLCFGTHLREQENFLYCCLAGHEHYQSVYAYAYAACRRHAVLQGTQEILVYNHCLVVAFVGKTHLFLETFFLIYRVVKLGIGVCQLFSVDHEFETFG